MTDPSYYFCSKCGNKFQDVLLFKIHEGICKRPVSAYIKWECQYCNTGGDGTSHDDCYKQLREHEKSCPVLSKTQTPTYPDWKCSNCTYFVANRFCYCKPPVISPITGASMRPRTEPDDFCCEFTERKK